MSVFGHLILLRVVPVLVILAGLALVLRHSIVGWLYESKPRVRRVEWRSKGSEIGPAEIRRLGELMWTGSNHAAGNCAGGGLAKTRETIAEAQVSTVPAGVAAGRRPSFADPDEGE